MISSDKFIFFGHKPALFLRAHYDFIDRLVQFQVADHRLSRTGGKDGRFVKQVCKISAGKTARDAGDHLEVDVRGKRLVARMHFQNRLAPLDVGKIDVDLAVKTPRPQERIVKDVGAVCRRDHDDPLIGIKPVHLNEDLIQRLLALVVAATEACAALTPDRIDLINEDDTRLIALCKIK